MFSEKNYLFFGFLIVLMLFLLGLFLTFNSINSFSNNTSLVSLNLEVQSNSVNNEIDSFNAFVPEKELFSKKDVHLKFSSTNSDKEFNCILKCEK